MRKEDWDKLFEEVNSMSDEEFEKITKETYEHDKKNGFVKVRWDNGFPVFYKEEK